MGLKDLTNQFRFLGIREPENIVSNFQEAVGTKINDKSFSGRRRHRGDTCIGKFTFMMRSLMMRHSQQMKYVGTSTTLMSLPALTEEVLTVEFSSADKTEYVKLETQARASYSSIAREMVSRSWMKLTASLLPMRVACSGGRLPLKTNKKETEPAEGNAVDKSQSEAEPSRYAFTSKLERLIEELEVVRDTEPKCKSKDRRTSVGLNYYQPNCLFSFAAKALVFSQYASALQWLQQELPKRGFQFRSLSGDMTMSQRSKALRDFQNDPPTTIFLLSMR
jgi:SNF2 family DNA or RNA helicase